VDILRKSAVLEREEKKAMYGRQPPRDIISESFHVTVEDEVLEAERRKDADRRARKVVERQWY
jgi:hypothetical protein